MKAALAPAAFEVEAAPEAAEPEPEVAGREVCEPDMVDEVMEPADEAAACCDEREAAADESEAELTEVCEGAGAEEAAPDEAGTAEVTADEPDAEAPLKQPELPAWTVRPDE